MQNYKDLEKNIEKDFSSVSSLETLQEFRLSYLGKKGKISLLMKLNENCNFISNKISLKLFFTNT